MAPSVVISSINGSLSSNNSSLVVLGCKEAVISTVSVAVRECCHADVCSSDVFHAFTKHLIPDLTANEHRTASSSVVVPLNGGSLTTLAVGVTPSSTSHHNCPSRPYLISKLTQSLAKKTCIGGDANGVSDKHNNVVSVVLAARCVEDMLPMVAGVARSSPQYSSKSKKGNEVSEQYQEEEKMTINVVIYVVESGTWLSDIAVISRMQAVVDGIQLAAEIVDMPPNELTPTTLMKRCKREMDNLREAGYTGITMETIQGEDLRERGFGGLYGVGKAALSPPVLIILKYTPKEKATQKVVWVGKGITYDTGGLSLKSPTNMPGMKRDCGGSAGILGAWIASVKIGAPEEITALLCMAENAIGPNATKPDDIHHLYSGKTVEINNTDAEGRLVLSDGVAYAAKNLSPDVIVNMCTLTGAQGIATGQRHATIVSNDATLEAATVSAGKKSGDLTWAMPYCPELFKPEFSSEVADFKNSVKNRSNAQPSCAAQFIANNLCGFEETGKWLHIDMAAPAHVNERATGYGVALLTSLFTV